MMVAISPACLHTPITSAGIWKTYIILTNFGAQYNATQTKAHGSLFQFQGSQPRHKAGQGLGMRLKNTQYSGTSLVPRPTPFFVLRFAFNIIHGGGRHEKRGRPGNTCHVNDVWWTRGGRRGGGGAQLQITY